MAKEKDSLKSTFSWSLLIAVAAIFGAIHFQNVADIPISLSPFFNSCYNYSPSDTADRALCVEAELPAYTSEQKQADDWRNGMITIAVISGFVFLVSASMLSDRKKAAKDSRQTR